MQQRAANNSDKFLLMLQEKSKKNNSNINHNNKIKINLKPIIGNNKIEMYQPRADRNNNQFFLLNKISSNKISSNKISYKTISYNKINSKINNILRGIPSRSANVGRGNMIGALQPPSSTTPSQNDESAIAQQLLLQQLSQRPNTTGCMTSTARRRNNSNPEMDSITRPILKAILPMWATSTWAQRHALLQRFEKHVQAHPQLQAQPIGLQMAAFVTASTTTKASTKLSYAKQLRALAKRLGKQTPVLDMTIAGLTVSANSIEPTQATPATRREMTAAMERAWEYDQSGRLAVSLYLAWKTASRWSDILSLSTRNFVEFDHRRNQVVVEWGTIKTNRRERYKPTGWVVVQEDRYPHMLRQLEQVVQALQPEQPLAPKTTAQLRTWFSRHQATQRLSAHSIKRGALDVLLEYACKGKLDPRMIALLAKHKDEANQFPAATLRYLANKGNMARMLGTQKATKLL